MKYPNDYWQTPPWLLDSVAKFFGPDWFDPCPALPTFDGLGRDWPERTYINPPFSQYLAWVKHGLQQPLEQIWVCHHDSSTQRFKLLVEGGVTLCLLSNRISFIHPETGKPKGTDIAKSQTLIYRGNRSGTFMREFKKHGIIAEVWTPA